MKKILTILTLSLVSLLLGGNVRAYNVYKSYKIGDQVKVAGENYYVIADSDNRLDYVTLLKEEPLTVDEVNTYGEGHINKASNYTSGASGVAHAQNGYGEIAYYSSETCGYADSQDLGSFKTSGCTNDYDQSDIKYVVDVWAKDKFKNNELQEVNRYKVRLITVKELRDDLGYNFGDLLPSGVGYRPSVSTPSWVYNSKYSYWTMSPVEDSSGSVWGVYISNIDDYAITSYRAVRPVINLAKEIESVIDDKGIADTNSKKNSTIVKVANTLLNQPMIPIIIGLVLIGIGITTYIIVLKKKK